MGIMFGWGKKKVDEWCDRLRGLVDSHVGLLSGALLCIPSKTKQIILSYNIVKN